MNQKTLLWIGFCVIVICLVFGKETLYMVANPLQIKGEDARFEPKFGGTPGFLTETFVGDRNKFTGQNLTPSECQQALFARSSNTIKRNNFTNDEMKEAWLGNWDTNVNNTIGTLQGRCQ